jgi:ABC-2 type transport system permease protein
LEKVVIPFFEYGVPVEYEVVRSLRTVAMPQRKRLGIVKNDAQFTGGFSMSNMRQVPRQPIVEELAKQYEVKEADLNAPLLADQFDVLMVVQPSLLSPQEMSNLVAAVKSGIPTAIFEDPFPFGFNFPGTGEPKQAPGGPFGGGGGMMPKGDIKELLKTLSIEMPGKPGAGGMLSPDVVWQQYNPYPKLQQMQAASDEWIFVREESPGGKDSFGPDSEISKELREVMLMYAGAIQPVKSDEFKITNLLSTGTQAGTIPYQELNTLVQSGQMSPNRIRQLQGPPTGRSVMAVQIEGTKPVAAPAAEKPADPAKAAEEKKEGDAKSGETKTENKERPIRAVFVADTDCMNPIFIEIRSRPEQFEDVDFRFQNVSFILNVIDVLSGEESYPAIRRHEPQHSTLRLLELESEDARGKEMDKRREFQKSYDDAIQEAEAENTKNIQRFEERVKKLQQEGAIDRSKFAELQEAMTQMEIERQKLQRKLGVKKEQLERVRDSQIQASQRDADLQILKIQNRYKMFAIFLPPIPPLLVGIGVFVSRRLREREGIPKSRLK